MPLPGRGPRRAWDAGDDGRALLDPLCEQVARHLRPGGSFFLVHSEVCGIDRTIEQLQREGLQTDIVARHRGPLGPLLRERVEEMWASGALAPGSMEEDVHGVLGQPRRKFAFGAERGGITKPSGFLLVQLLQTGPVGHVERLRLVGADHAAEASPFAARESPW